MTKLTTRLFWVRITAAAAILAGIGMSVFLCRASFAWWFKVLMVSAMLAVYVAPGVFIWQIGASRRQSPTHLFRITILICRLGLLMFPLALVIPPVVSTVAYNALHLAIPGFGGVISVVGMTVLFLLAAVGMQVTSATILLFYVIRRRTESAPQSHGEAAL